MTQAERREAFEAELREMRPVIERRSLGLCEADTVVCSGRATMLHHRWRKGQGGVNREWNLLHVCPSCHTYIHDHPAESYAVGWLMKRWQGVAALAVTA